MVRCSISIGERVEILSRNSINFGCRGTVVKLTAKRVCVAVNPDIDTPFDQRERIYVLPKNLRVLDSDEYTSGDYPQPHEREYDPDELFSYPSDSDSSDSDDQSDFESLSESPYSKDFYKEFMLLRAQFLEDVQELIMRYSGDVRTRPPST